MSFEKSYIRNLTHKYRLAVALAVLKEKPEHLTVEEYLKELQTNIQCDSTDDLDLTIRSDDFDLEDGETVDETCNFKDNRVFNDYNVIDGNFNDNDRLSNDVGNDNGIDRSKDIYNDGVVTVTDTFLNENNDMVTASCSQDSVNILKDINTNLIFNEIRVIEKNLEVVNNDTLAATKEHDYATHIKETSQKSTQSTKSKFDDNSTNCNTEIVFQNDTVSNKNSIGNVIEEPIYIVNEVTANELHIDPVNEVCVVNNTTADIDTFYDSQATEMYSVHGFTQNYTHVSQSQNYESLTMNDKFIKSKNNKINARTEIRIEIEPETVNTSKKIKIIDDLIVDERLREINEELNILSNLPVEGVEKLAINLNQYSQALPSELVNQNSMDTYGNFSQNLQEFNENQYEDTSISKNAPIESIAHENNEDIEMNEDDEIYNNETEIVSFKVIEELNKIKNYITKSRRRISNDGSSLDSGYKSDSQKSSYRNSLQLSGNWLNQSAHSLYEYITQCPLLPATQEIVGEIAKVLGQLIDKLHEEEKYPSFLEELLEYVEHLLQELLHGRSGEDVLLQKDEITQRLFLLNKSFHIQKFTLEKIVGILEDLHIHLTNTEDAYEMTNTNETENVSYIFHVLEQILQRYSKENNLVSQEISQGELKKSSIADIWRRKWNPKYREDVGIEECSPKKCVLLKCNEVLNKLVVSCMEGYSLVAFSALQCFNMLQS